ncbi:P-loop containing nucleoside triphosphate hydrolase protein [Dactylonectria macrodidyma]|uniref:P-loop containing nucleoside triphosphate hydrolase protein n=1 Tax=Dactylonectria macrodidyma TaxID=307937 RepID=A0A9P9J419_9HYPO|nr:P-loop containing nucleoside triphosphate hydrolase protein [Dactylonectria macrodidyma]
MPPKKKKPEKAPSTIPETPIYTDDPLDAARSRHMTPDEWRHGWVVAVSENKAPIPQLAFHKVQSSPASPEEMAVMVKEWKGHVAKNQIPVESRLLKADKMDSNQAALVAYLGLKGSHELFYVLDCKCPIVLQPLIALFARQAESASSLAILDLGLQWLHKACQAGSHADHVLVKKNRERDDIFFSRKDVPDMEEVDLQLSMFAAMFQIMRYMPMMFSQPVIEKKQSVWGIHQEDWHRAHSLISAFKSRRTKIKMYPFEDAPLPANQAPSWYGLATADVVAMDESREAEVDKSIVAQEWAKELAMVGTSTDQFNAERIWAIANPDAIATALGETDRFKRMTRCEQKKALEDVDGQVPDLISEAVCQSLQAIAPGIDLAAQLKKKNIAKNADMPAMSKDDRAVLLSMLRKRASVYSKGLPEHATQRTAVMDTIAGQKGILQAMAHAEAEVLGYDAGVTQQVDDAFNQAREAELHELHKTRSLLGEIVRGEQDIELLCNKHDINVDTFQVNPYNSQTRAKAPQISDANRLSELLLDAPRFAFLLNECGTGKTFTICLTLQMMIKQRKLDIETRPGRLWPGERKYKPTFIFSPASTLDQTYNEINTMWNGVFRVFCLYQTRDNCPNPARKMNTIDSTAEMQVKIDEWAKDHENPATAGIIVLTSYQTGLQRLSAAGESIKLSSTELKRRMANDDLTLEEEEELEGLLEQGLAVESVGGDESTTTRSPPDPRKGRSAAFIKDRRKKVKNDDWFLVVADESHYIKNPTTEASKLFKQLICDSRLFVSATAMSNHVRDIEGYLWLAWDPAWSFGYKEKADPTPSSRFYDTGTWDEICELGHSHSYVETDIDIDEERLIHGSPLDEETLSTSQRRRRAEYEGAIEKKLMPLYQFHPQLFSDFASEHQYNHVVSEAVGEMLQWVAVKRGMLTPIKLPGDRGRTCMGEGIAPLTIETVELEPSYQVRSRLKLIISRLIDKVMIIGDAYLPELFPGGMMKSSAKLWRNGAIYRRLALASTDSQNIALTTPTTRLLHRLKDMHSGCGSGAREYGFRGEDEDAPVFHKHDALDIDQDVTPDKRKRQLRAQAKSRPIPAAGAEEVDRVMSLDTTGGLQWYFYNTNDNGRYGYPTERLNLARYVVWESPKYARVLQRVLELTEEGHRILIYVNNPLTSMMVNALLVCIGMKTLHYTSRNSQNERDSAIARFNDRTNDYQCLITSMKLAAFGVNFHKACHHGIIVEPPENLSILLHATGRLWRIGQKHHVRWEILYLRHSFDAWIESRNLEKAVTTLAAECSLDPRITGQARMIACFEMLRIQLGQKCSRYPRTRVSWHEQDSSGVEREGFFYSELGRFIIAHPELAAFVGDQNIKQIAMSWKIGTPLTEDHINMRMPELEDGVRLGNFASEDDKANDEKETGRKESHGKKKSETSNSEHEGRREDDASLTSRPSSSGDVSKTAESLQSSSIQDGELGISTDKKRRHAFAADFTRKKRKEEKW